MASLGFNSKLPCEIEIRLMKQIHGWKSEKTGSADYNRHFWTGVGTLGGGYGGADAGWVRTRKPPLKLVQSRSNAAPDFKFLAGALTPGHSPVAPITSGYPIREKLWQGIKSL